MPLTRAKDVVVLAQSAVAVSHTGNTNETTLATVTIPAGMMGANGRVEITFEGSNTNNANAKTYRVKFGGTSYSAAAVTASATIRHVASISNVNSASSQKGGLQGLVGGHGVSISAISTSAIDTTADVTLLITGQLANAADTITLESYIVTVYPRR